MSNPREPFERRFDGFDKTFLKVSIKEGFVFEKRAGPNIGRALRIKDDPFKRGVFLELKDHWGQTDLADPKVTFAYGAWFYPNGTGFPTHFLGKVFYEGKLSELGGNFEGQLLQAAIEVKSLSKEVIISQGRLFSDWPTPEEASKI